MENTVDKRELIFCITQEIQTVIKDIQAEADKREQNGDLLYLMNLEALLGKINGYLQTLIFIDDSYKTFVTEYESIKEFSDSVLQLADKLYRELKTRV